LFSFGVYRAKWEHPMANITQSAAFDFFFGRWHVAHRRLRARLVGSDDWQVFDGSCSVLPLLGGLGNVDDNLLNLPDGPYRAVTLRSFDSVSDQWSIWWLDGRRPHQLDTPVIGQFADGLGTFLARDSLNGRPILVRFTWRSADPDRPRWEQAFSPDNGASWETNWQMDFRRA
jgi:hypothetical protein